MPPDYRLATMCKNMLSQIARQMRLQSIIKVLAQQHTISRELDSQCSTLAGHIGLHVGTLGHGTTDNHKELRRCRRQALLR